MSNKGFSLFEILAVVTIISILAMLAYPMMTNQLASMEATKFTRQINNVIRFSKIHSYSYNQTLTMCLTTDGKHCDKNGNYSLIVFKDNDKNHQYDVETDNLLLEQALKLKYAKVSLHLGARRNYIKFWGDTGLPRGYFGHIKYCPTEHTQTNKFVISLNQHGRVRKKDSTQMRINCIN